jgi:hypothetical protein
MFSTGMVFFFVNVFYPQLVEFSDMEHTVKEGQLHR